MEVMTGKYFVGNASFHIFLDVYPKGELYRVADLILSYDGDTVTSLTLRWLRLLAYLDWCQERLYEPLRCRLQCCLSLPRSHSVHEVL